MDQCGNDVTGWTVLADGSHCSAELGSGGSTPEFPRCCVPRRIGLRRGAGDVTGGGGLAALPHLSEKMLGGGGGGGGEGGGRRRGWSVWIHLIQVDLDGMGWDGMGWDEIGWDVGFLEGFWVDSWRWTRASYHFSKMLGDSLGFFGILWDSLRVSLGFFEILRDTLEIFAFFLRYFEMLWDSLRVSLGFFEILWDLFEMLRDTVRFFGILWDTLRFFGIF